MLSLHFTVMMGKDSGLIDSPCLLSIQNQLNCRQIEKKIHDSSAMTANCFPEIKIWQTSRTTTDHQCSYQSIMRLSSWIYCISHFSHISAPNAIQVVNGRYKFCSRQIRPGPKALFDYIDCLPSSDRQFNTPHIMTVAMINKMNILIMIHHYCSMIDL